MTDEIHEVFALKYAERLERVRADSFLFDDHASHHPLDYYVWVVRNAARTVIVDTGYDADEGARRDRPVLADPATCLRDFGVDPETVDTVIITHLHYDHAGTLGRFPAARFHLQAAEMAYATGPCMCDTALNHPFTADHVCDMVRHVYSGRVVFHDGDGEIAPGLEVAAIGGHSMGLQAVRVRTRRGWMVLASDASHFYENFGARKLFPIVADAPAMLRGFDRLDALADRPELILPGHDPLVRAFFPFVAGDRNGTSVHRLDADPIGDPVSYLASLSP